MNPVNRNESLRRICTNCAQLMMLRRICTNCAQLMTLVRRTRDLRATWAIFDFECESCGVGYTEVACIRDGKHRCAGQGSP